VGYLVFGYLGSILEMLLAMIVVAVIWRWIAKIRLRPWHLLALAGIAVVILILVEEANYRSTGHYNPKTPATVGFAVIAVYLAVWTIWSKLPRKGAPSPKAEKQDDVAPKNGQGE
jgi:membrane-associated PAP2 superfamily phosphatase